MLYLTTIFLVTITATLHVECIMAELKALSLAWRIFPSGINAFVI